MTAEGRGIVNNQNIFSLRQGGKGKVSSKMVIIEAENSGDSRHVEDFFSWWTSWRYVNTLMTIYLGTLLPHLHSRQEATIIPLFLQYAVGNMDST